MVTIKDMSRAYVAQVKARIDNTQQELNRLVQHLQECENELEFNQAEAKGTLAPESVAPNRQEVSQDQQFTSPFGSEEKDPIDTIKTEPLTVAETSLFRGAKES